MSSTTITIEEAKLRIQEYCAVQDRCQFEVEQKLKAWGLISLAVDEVLMDLIASKFVDEERFAKSFARSKFNQKNWGKRKIQHELKLKKVSMINIAAGLKEIDEEEYLEKLSKLASKKLDSVKDRNHWSRKSKTARYLIQKGYESKLVYQTLDELNEK